MDDQQVRAAAGLMAALVHPREIPDPAVLTAYADRLVPWITGPGPASTISITAVIDGRAVTLITSPGGIMAQTVSATVDSSIVTLTAATKDDHGDPTPDQLTWGNDDTAGIVATWTVSADTKTYTGTLNHAEGTVSITVTDPSAPALGITEIQLVVGPGATSQIVVTPTVS